MKNKELIKKYVERIVKIEALFDKARELTTENVELWNSLTEKERAFLASELRITYDVRGSIAYGKKLQKVLED